MHKSNKLFNQPRQLSTTISCIVYTRFLSIIGLPLELWKTYLIVFVQTTKIKLVLILQRNLWLMYNAEFGLQTNTSAADLIVKIFQIFLKNITKIVYNAHFWENTVPVTLLHRTAFRISARRPALQTHKSGVSIPIDNIANAYRTSFISTVEVLMLSNNIEQKNKIEIDPNCKAKRISRRWFCAAAGLEPGSTCRWHLVRANLVTIAE